MKGTIFNMKLAISVVQVLLSLALVAIVMLQSGKSAGLSGSIAGGADTFLSKGKATPFEGWKVHAECKLTICGDSIAYDAL